MELYTKQYPGGWEDLPSEDTPATAAIMTAIEQGIYDNSSNAIKLDNVTKYLTPTAAANGDFKNNITNALATGMIINVAFGTATNGSSNARYSIDNGINYKNVKSAAGYQLLASEIVSKKLILYYDGTDFIALNINDIGKVIKVGKSGNQSISATTQTKITWDTTVDNNTKGLSLDDANDRIIIGKGINTLFVNGQYQENTLTTGIQKYIYIWKNGSLFKAYQINNEPIVDITAIVPVTENDYIELYCYGSLALTVQSNTSWNFLQATVLS